MDRDFLIDLFADFGPVTIRPMFSGFGISADGTNFALALRAGLYLPRRRADHSAVRGGRLKAVSYQTRAKTVTVNSYWQLPERLYDDPEDLTGWARAALAAAQRAALRKRPKAKKAARRRLQPSEGRGQKEAAKRKVVIRGARSRASRRMAETVRPMVRDAQEALLTMSAGRRVDLTPPGCGSRRRIPDRLRRSRGCGRCAWRRRGRHRRVRSANPYRRPASAWKRRPRW